MVSVLPPSGGGLPLGITAWPRCQSVGKGESGNTERTEGETMSETRIREEICRLGRSLFERGLTPGSSGNISVKLDDGGWLVTPTNASLGFARPGADVAARRGWTAGIRRRPDQGSAAAHRALPDPRRGARGGASAFDPLGGIVDAARDRPPRRAAADDALLSDEMRPDRARALLSARRSGRRRRHQGTGRQILVRAARQPRAGGFRAIRWKRRCSRSRNWKRRRNSICCCAG